MSDLNFELRIGQRRALDAKITEIQRAHKEQLKPYKDALDKLDVLLLDMLTQSKQENARTNAGTVYKTTKYTASITNLPEFQRHVIGTESWDLVDWKANLTATKEFATENKALPPGVKLSARVDIGVTAPAKPKGEKLSVEEVEALPNAEPEVQEA
jgi:hypothetical protein